MIELTDKITPCLWFDDRIQEAVHFYISVFGGRISDTSYYGDAVPQQKGKVLTITFTLAGNEFVALNGGPHFKFNEAVSFMVKCKDQAEVDRYWDALTADGGAESECSWLKDKYGLSWQIVPEALWRSIGDKDAARAQRVMQAMMTMKKIDVAAIEKAAAG